jgi:hypothetical protein
LAGLLQFGSQRFALARGLAWVLGGFSDLIRVPCVGSWSRERCEVSHQACEWVMIDHITALVSWSESWKAWDISQPPLYIWSVQDSGVGLFSHRPLPAAMGLRSFEIAVGSGLGLK